MGPLLAVRPPWEGGGQSNFLASRRAPGVCGGKGGGFVRIDSGALAGRQVTSFTAVLLAM